MILEELLNQVKKFHASSPMLPYYSNLFLTTLNSHLFESKITKEQHHRYSALLNNIIANSEGYILPYSVDSIIGKYKRDRGIAEVLLESNLSSIKFISSLSKEICEVLKDQASVRVDAFARYKFILELCKAVNDNLDSQDRRVYGYLKELEIACIKASQDYSSIPELEELFGIFIHLKLKVYETDSWFYKEYVKSYYKYDTVSTSNVFSGEKIDYSFNQFLVDKTIVLEGLLIPSKRGKVTKDYVLNTIINSNMPIKLKDYCNSIMCREFDDVVYNLCDVLEGFAEFNKHKDDFIYFCTSATLDETRALANHIIHVTQPMSLIKFYASEANIKYISSGFYGDYNDSLWGRLTELQKYGFIPNAEEVFKVLKISVD